MDLALCLATLVVPAPVLAADQEVSQPEPPTEAQVVVTATLESLRVPMVTVELRNADTNAVIARTISDGLGLVTFPDVPVGRYIVPPPATASPTSTRRRSRPAPASPSRCCSRCA